MAKWKKITLIVLAVLLAIALLLVGTFFILSFIGKSQFHKQDTHIVAPDVIIQDENTISYKDKKYVLNKNVISILVIGVDRDNIDEDLGIGNNGQADVIFVATIDTKTKKSHIIPISRETMVDVNQYATNGKYTGVKQEQLCLAYAYGSTPEQCSENVMASVRRLLYGINISSYVTIEMEGLERLTDLVGGINVTCLEDMWTKRLAASKGEKLLLNGTQATAYIQYRGDDDEANARRMERQKQFLSALLNKTGNSVVNNFSNLTKYYNDLSPYFSTNVTFAQITYLAQNCLSLNFGDALNYKNIEGKLVQGEKWIEFYHDEETTIQTIIDIFYTPVD